MTFLSLVSNLFLVGIFASPKELNTKENNSLSVDYLKNTPENDYIISTGDKLRISVADDYPELFSKVTISSEGTVYLPLLGKIYIDQLTLEELRNLLDKAYFEYIDYPKSKVEIINYRPIKFLIIGEVNNPGIYTLKGAMTTIEGDLITDETFAETNSGTDFPFEKNKNQLNYYFPSVFDAIRTSGGITINSDLSNIELTRKDTISNGSGRKITTLNFNNVFENLDQTQNIRIMDGDTIKIKKLTSGKKQNLITSIQSNLNPKYITVNVVGRVNNPGLKRMTRLSTLNDAIDIAGGTKVLKGPIRYLTINNDGTVDKRKIRYKINNKRGTFPNPYLKNGDLVIVGNSLASSSAQFVNELTEPFKGIFSAYGLIKAINE